MKLRFAYPALASAALGLGSLQAADYYVDFDGGSNANSGTSKEQAWKQSPGDPAATGTPADTILQPGDQVIFRGGVRYRGQIEAGSSGTEEQKISYIGNAWGTERAIIDGSEPLLNWERCATADDAQGNPNFAKIYKTTVDTDEPFTLNLHETPVSGNAADDEFLWIAQEPNPENRYFYDRKDSFHPIKNDDLSRGELEDKENLKGGSNISRKGASVLVWVNPNKVERRKIVEHSTSSGTIEFDENLASNAIYSDDRDHYYAIYNSVADIDTPGEYATREISEGRYELFLWPRSSERLEERINYSVRKNGIELSGENHLAVRGFTVTKFAGSGLRDGRGIFSDGKGEDDLFTTGLEITDNFITHNKHTSSGYGGIYLQKAADSLVANNHLEYNPDHRGIFLNNCRTTEVRENEIHFPGGTAIGIYLGDRLSILRNRIDNSLATHANGITMYIASKNILVAGNTITNCTTPLTFQDSGDLYFINNFIDGGGEFKNANEWGSTKRGPWANGKIVFWNNTFVGAAAAAALNIGKEKRNTYLVQNNILAGITTSKLDWDEIDRSNNLYVDKSFQQKSAYNWELEKEEEIGVDPALLFENPENGDYTRRATSKASGAGADLSSEIAKIDDIKGIAEAFGYDIKSRPFDIGSHTSSPVQSPVVDDSSQVPTVPSRPSPPRLIGTAFR